MTIGTIFKRYEVPAGVAEKALTRGAFVLALKDAWVGPEVRWQLVIKALVFADLGEQSGHIRKKIGLDKYIVTLIARGVPKFAETVATSHDWHQKLYAYCLWHDDHEALGIRPHTWLTLKQEVKRNLLLEVASPLTLNPGVRSAILGINILHYKNPSV